MNRFNRRISTQFRNPHGFLGRIICGIQNMVNKRMYLKTVSLVNVDEASRVLDIGYGNGYLLKLLYKKKASDLYGIDISADAKQMAERMNKKALKNHHLHLEVGNCCRLPFESESFGAITSINTIYFWRDGVEGLSEMRRVLKSGGAFYNVVFTKRYLDTITYTQEGFKKYLKDDFYKMGIAAGFTNIEIQDIIPGKNYVVIYTKD